MHICAVSVSMLVMGIEKIMEHIDFGNFGPFLNKRPE